MSAEASHVHVEAMLRAAGQPCAQPCLCGCALRFTFCSAGVSLQGGLCGSVQFDSRRRSTF